MALESHSEESFSKHWRKEKTIEGVNLPNSRSNCTTMKKIKRRVFFFFFFLIQKDIESKNVL